MFSSNLPINYTNFDDTFLLDGWNLHQFPDIFYKSNKTNLIIISPKEFELPWSLTNDDDKLKRFNKILNDIPFGADIILGGTDYNYISIDKFPKNTRFHLWPLYWMTKKTFDYQFYKYMLGPIPPIELKVSKPYVFLNNKRNMHRILMMNELHIRKILDEQQISWRGRGPLFDGFLESNLKYTITWNEKIVFPSVEMQVCDETYPNYFLLPDAFYKAFVMLIGETTINTTFFTEKLIIPLLYEKPFLTIAAPGYFYNLKNLGFELYDEVFDYSFDSEIDNLKRIKLIADNVENLLGANFLELNEIIKPKLIKNRKRLLELSVDTNHIPPIVKNYLSYIKNNPKNTLTETEIEYLELYNSMLDKRLLNA